MQTKVVIGTLSFMLVMVIMGLATLLEPARLQETTEAFEGRQIENGAVIFKESCSECHGIEGKALTCKDAQGTEKPCVGLPLNHVALLCGDPSARLIQTNWQGSKANFIRQTVAAGRTGTQMPTWSQEFGGPMEDYQVDQVAAYVLNWAEDPALCPEEEVIFEPVDWPDSWEDLPEGVAEDGQAAYTTFGCTACHGQPGGDIPAAIGPDLSNISNVAATRIDGLSAQEYIYQSILDPNAFIAPECPNGPCPDPSSMPGDFGLRMTEQDMANIIAYYMTLTTE